jgi:hypothetical protein
MVSYWTLVLPVLYNTVQYCTVLYCSIHRGHSIRVGQVAVCPGRYRTVERSTNDRVGPDNDVDPTNSSGRATVESTRMDEVWCVPSRWVLDADAVPWTGCAGRTVQYGCIPSTVLRTERYSTALAK